MTNGHSAPDIHVQLVHIDGPYKGKIDEFNKERITIGRDPSNDVVFPAELRSISRHHAELLRNGNEFTFVSLGKNSCLMNQTALDTCVLKPGDMIWLTQEGPRISFLSREIKKSPAPNIQKEHDRKIELSLKQYEKQKQQKTEFTFQFETNIRSMHKTVVRLGSSTKCDFVLPHPNTAAFQTEILFRDEHFYVRDISGKSSTFVNREPAIPEIRLHENDIVTFGTDGPRMRFLGTGRFSQVRSPTQDDTLPDTSMINIFDQQESEIETVKLFLQPRTQNKGVTFVQSLFRRIWP
ncbi:MAG: FHA domain-containing protein [Gammaproteobacteria bacterium]|nr:FHA domain-containing protein [Gammaproteobacteria bacterium]